MYRRILVPLDGSKLAEAALPLAIRIAKCFDSEVILFHGLEQNPPETIHGEPHIRSREDAKHYFQALQESLSREVEGSKVTFTIHIHEEKYRDVVTSIVDHIQELKPNLIVLCSHGQPSLKKKLLGSIPLKILSRGTIPVLLVRKPMGTIKEVLVALDSSSRHDEAIETAVHLSDAWGTKLTLLTVVPTVPTLKGSPFAAGLHLPKTTRALLDLEALAIHEHLDTHMKQIGTIKGSIHTIVQRGDPVKKIIQTANSIDSPLLVLGTHRKIGLEAFWSGSVAMQVASRSEFPVFLVPLSRAT
jgi:nucleotide-binding universal stress UspA family protein